MYTEPSFQPPPSPYRLFESGVIHLTDENKSSRSGEINRGMSIISRDGYLAGYVAAVVVDLIKNRVISVLFNRGRQVVDYRLVSVDTIEYVGEYVILLNINRAYTASLSEWRGRPD